MGQLLFSLSCCGHHERVCFDRVQNSESLYRCLFEEEVFSLWSIWAKDLLRHVKSSVLNKNSLIPDVQIFTGLFISTFSCFLRMGTFLNLGFNVLKG